MRKRLYLLLAAHAVAFCLILAMPGCDSPEAARAQAQSAISDAQTVRSDLIVQRDQYTPGSEPWLKYDAQIKKLEQAIAIGERALVEAQKDDGNPFLALSALGPAGGVAAVALGIGWRLVRQSRAFKEVVTSIEAARDNPEFDAAFEKVKPTLTEKQSPSTAAMVAKATST